MKTRQRTPDLYRAIRGHPNWRMCESGCGWPVDPAVGDTHPGCESKQQRKEN